MENIKKLYKLRKTLKIKDYKEMCDKIIIGYFFNIIILRKKGFKINFKSKHTKPLKLRIDEDFEYFCQYIYIKFFFRSKYYTSETKKYFYPIKPMHFKMLAHINEAMLENFLNKIDMEIKNENLNYGSSSYTSYSVSRKN